MEDRDVKGLPGQQARSSADILFAEEETTGKESKCWNLVPEQV